MLKSKRWQRLMGISIVTLGVMLIPSVTILILSVGMVSLSVDQPDPQQFLGIPLPPSATDYNIDMQRYLGGYNAYLRFELTPHDVNTLLGYSAFPPTATNTNPYVGLENASLGNTSLATIVQRERPVWWDPPLEGSYILSRVRPEAQYNSPDYVWYVIDVSDAARAIVYVYVVEV